MLVMSVIDVVFAAVLVTTLIVTWRLWYFQGEPPPRLPPVPISGFLSLLLFHLFSFRPAAGFQCRCRFGERCGKMQIVVLSHFSRSCAFPPPLLPFRFPPSFRRTKPLGVVGLRAILLASSVLPLLHRLGVFQLGGSQAFRRPPAARFPPVLGGDRAGRTPTDDTGALPQWVGYENGGILYAGKDDRLH